MQMRVKITASAESISEVNAKVQLLHREPDQKKSRAKNLVIRGIPEKSSDENARTIATSNPTQRWMSKNGIWKCFTA